LESLGSEYRAILHNIHNSEPQARRTPDEVLFSAIGIPSVIETTTPLIRAPLQTVLQSSQAHPNCLQWEDGVPVIHRPRVGALLAYRP
jgi:hypothetical protein